ncbi:MAG: hypothetical protein R3D34_16380 [Nitratireductor sp.]
MHEVRSAVTLDAAAAQALRWVLARCCRHGRFFYAAPIYGVNVLPFFAGGIAELGLDPRQFARVQAANTHEALWAAGEIAATPKAGLCLLELQGNPGQRRILPSRRIALCCRIKNPGDPAAPGREGRGKRSIQPLLVRPALFAQPATGQ